MRLFVLTSLSLLLLAVSCAEDGSDELPFPRDAEARAEVDPAADTTPSPDPDTHDRADGTAPAPADAITPADTTTDSSADAPPVPTPDAAADAPLPTPEVSPDVTTADTAAPADVAPLPSHVLGLPLVEDGVLYAGAAAVDITPDPERETVFLAGFGINRRAQGVRDPIWARALVLSRDREYIAIVAVDLVGVTGYRAGRAAARLAVDGFAAERLIVHSTHNHSGPDTIGQWGPTRAESGLSLDYQERLEGAIEEAVRAAAAEARPATVRVGARRTRELSPYFTSARFGGKLAAQRDIIGLIRDTRDPVVIDDELTAIGLFARDSEDSPDKHPAAIATLLHVNTHMEAAGAPALLTSDFAHAARELLEAHFGGHGIVWVGAVGGLQNPLGVDLPETDENGTVLWRTCEVAATEDPADVDCHGRSPGDVRHDEDGVPLPRFVSGDRFRMADSYGRLLAGVARDLIEAAEPETAPELRVRTTPLYLPLENRIFEMTGLEQDPALLDPIAAIVADQYPEYLPMLDELRATLEAAIFDFPAWWLVTDERCPQVTAANVPGCLPTRLWIVRIGPLEILTVPGELTPELSVGMPPDSAPEAHDETMRGPGALYFPQHHRACDGVAWSRCRNAVRVGDCDCRRFHAVPYDLGTTDTAAPLFSYLDGPHRIILGLAGDMVGYILPADDFLRVLTRPMNQMVSFGLMDAAEYISNPADHYEELVSVGPSMALLIQAAVAAMTCQTHR
jgi:hypothetical protein